LTLIHVKEMISGSFPKMDHTLLSGRQIVLPT
jgi:hypothetical protein